MRRPTFAHMTIAALASAILAILFVRVRWREEDPGKIPAPSQHGPLRTTDAPGMPVHSSEGPDGGESAPPTVEDPETPEDPEPGSGSVTAGWSSEEARTWALGEMKAVWEDESDLVPNADGTLDPLGPEPLGRVRYEGRAADQKEEVRQKQERMYARFQVLWEEARRSLDFRRVLASIAADPRARGYERRHAISALAMVNTDDAIDALASLLRPTESPSIRWLAVQALAANRGCVLREDGTVGYGAWWTVFPSNGAIVPDQVFPLTDRRVISALTTYFAGETEPELRRSTIQCLGGIPSKVKREAVERSVGSETRPDYRALGAFLLRVAQTDPSIEVRMVAAAKVAASDLPEMMDAANHMMWSDPEPKVRATVATSILWKRRDETTLRTMEELLARETDRYVRLEVLGTIAQLTAYFSNQDLVRIFSRAVLEDPDRDIRENSARDLGSLGTPEAIEVIREALAREKSERVARVLREVLRKHQDK